MSNEIATKNLATLPDFPVFECDDATAAFGCRRDKYVSRDEAYVISRQLRDEVKIFSALFFTGGKLADHGIKFKPGIDTANAMRCLRGLMCSFAPPHEAKEATVALALHHWTEAARATGAK